VAAGTQPGCPTSSTQRRIDASTHRRIDASTHHREKRRRIVSKSLSRTLYLLSILGLIVGIALYVYVYVVAANQGALDANGNPTLTGTGATLALVGLVFYVVAGILATIA
jgi:hypothetical protein